MTVTFSFASYNWCATYIVYYVQHGWVIPTYITIAGERERKRNTFGKSVISCNKTSTFLAASTIRCKLRLRKLHNCLAAYEKPTRRGMTRRHRACHVRTKRFFKLVKFLYFFDLRTHHTREFPFPFPLPPTPGLFVLFSFTMLLFGIVCFNTFEKRTLSSMNKKLTTIITPGMNVTFKHLFRSAGSWLFMMRK